MFLLVVNHKTEEISVIAIHRNTMTDVKVYKEDGTFDETRKLQICLQHGYGDGMRTSCLRSVEAVSNLFYGLPIDGYLSLNMDGISILNDGLGGVTVEVLEDLKWQEKGIYLYKGETVKLTGEEAYVYLRARDTESFDSASLRLQRQMQYLKSLFKELKYSAGIDLSQLVDVYDSLEDYLVSSVDFQKLAKKISGYKLEDSQIYQVPGETFMGSQFEEYYVDEKALYEMILEVFYEPAE